MRNAQALRACPVRDGARPAFPGHLTSALGWPQGLPRTTHRREGLGRPGAPAGAPTLQAGGGPRPSPSPAEEGPGDLPQAMAESGWGPALCPGSRLGRPGRHLQVIHTF